MLRFTFCFGLFALLVGSCFRPTAPHRAMAAQVTDYSMGDNSYGVLVTEGGTLAEATRLARQRAGEIAFQQGYRYITIESEGEVAVAGSSGSEQMAPAGNLYQEMIVERGFGGDTAAQSGGGAKSFTAFRLIFTCHEKRPRKGAIDVCSLIRCD